MAAKRVRGRLAAPQTRPKVRGEEAGRQRCVVNPMPDKTEYQTLLKELTRLRGHLREIEAQNESVVARLRELASQTDEAEPGSPGGKPAAAVGRMSLDTLSDRELQIAALIATGSTPKEIAFCLGISVKTVYTIRERIRAKLGLHTDARLIARLAALFPG